MGRTTADSQWRQFSALNKLQLVTNLPADGSVLPSPLSISASVPQPNVGTEITVSVDGLQVAAGGSTLKASIPLRLGTQLVTLSAGDSTGQNLSQTAQIKVRA